MADDDLDERLSRRFGSGVDDGTTETEDTRTNTSSPLSQSNESAQTSQNIKNIKKEWNVRSFRLNNGLDDRLTTTFNRLDLDVSESDADIDLKRTLLPAARRTRIRVSGRDGSHRTHGRYRIERYSTTITVREPVTKVGRGIFGGVLFVAAVAAAWEIVTAANRSGPFSPIFDQPAMLVPAGLNLALGGGPAIAAAAVINEFRDEF